VDEPVVKIKSSVRREILEANERRARHAED
jgi:hypothetical protein